MKFLRRACCHRLGWAEKETPMSDIVLKYPSWQGSIFVGKEWTVAKSFRRSLYHPTKQDSQGDSRQVQTSATCAAASTFQDDSHRLNHPKSARRAMADGEEGPMISRTHVRNKPEPRIAYGSAAPSSIRQIGPSSYRGPSDLTTTGAGSLSTHMWISGGFLPMRGATTPATPPTSTFTT